MGMSTYSLILKLGALIKVSSQPHASPAFTPGEDLPMHMEGLLNTKAALDVLEKNVISFSPEKSNQVSSVFVPIISHYAGCSIAAAQQDNVSGRNYFQEMLIPVQSIINPSN